MSFIRKTLTALLCLIATGTVNADPSEAGEFSDYYDGAIIVYMEKINPSVEVSKRFHEHLLKMYTRSNCYNAEQCYMMGEVAANQFVHLMVTENEKYEFQRISSLKRK